MNYQESLNYFRNRQKMYLDDKVQKYENMAIKALEKQIPTKPIIKSWSPASCPNCGELLSESLGDGYYKHHVCVKICECGQKLNWESEGD